MSRIINCILIRHGKTQGNNEGRYIGCRSDEELSPIGIEEIRQIRAGHTSLSSDNIHIRLFSSPLIRAKDTAKLLFPETEIHIAEELKEIDFGSFEGKSYAELNGDPDYQRFIDSSGSIPAPGGESCEEFAKRTMQGLFKCLDYLSKDIADHNECSVHSFENKNTQKSHEPNAPEYPPPDKTPDKDEALTDAKVKETEGKNGAEETAVIVCHGGSIMAIMSTLTGKEFYDFYVNNLGGYELTLEYDFPAVNVVKSRPLT
jgi:alpha-ribazole phosphatase